MSTNFIENIQEYCGTDSNEVVLAVPLHFGNKEKTQMRYSVYIIMIYSNKARNNTWKSTGQLDRWPALISSLVQ